MEGIDCCDIDFIGICESLTLGIIDVLQQSLFPCGFTLLAFVNL